MSKILEGKKLALIIPVYNEGHAITSNFEEINRILLADEIHAHFLLIDDGSSDDTWAELKALSETYATVEAIGFARNFGKELALCAALDHIEADYYVIMDSDLQHPPRYIKTMLELMEKEQVNIVEGVKSNRGKESFFHRLFAVSFYKILKAITKLDLDNSSDFKLMDRRVVEAIRQFNERNVFFRGLVTWVGFKKIQMPFEVEERKLGTTHFSPAKLVLTALNAILAYTSKPLYITVFSGLIFLLFALILGVQTLVNYFTGIANDGFSTVILLLLITGSMMMLSLGMIGIYISRIYDEIKGRPRYVISERTKK
jgi:dolichol-phosphate mannosyltransferase